MVNSFSLHVYVVIIRVGMIRDVIASFPFLVTMAMTVWAEPPVTVTVARLVQGEGHAVGRGNKVFSKCETKRVWSTRLLHKLF